jgi:hypothetical protein
MSHHSSHSVISSPIQRAVATAALLTAALVPSAALACACGCGVFDVGTASMLPSGPGGMIFQNYDYQDQNRNWSGTGPAGASENGDKDIRTNFYTTGVQYMFSGTWGVQVEVPYDNRSFTTTGGASGNDIVSLDWSTLGDIRVEGIYTGFSADLSSGLTFGLKLPTGSYTREDAYGDIDRDSELGTGSTDILLGGFHRQDLAAGGAWTWFAQGLLDVPVLTQVQYRPGVELDTAAGIYYNHWRIDSARISPLAQIIASERTRDTGANSANPVASGYQRVLLSPGIEIDVHPFKFYADVEFPVFEHFRGDQLVAPELVKASVSYMF